MQVETKKEKEEGRERKGRKERDGNTGLSYP